MAEIPRRWRKTCRSRFSQEKCGPLRITGSALAGQVERGEGDLGFGTAASDCLLEPSAGALRIPLAIRAAQKGVRQRDLALDDALFGRRPEPSRGGVRVLFYTVAARIEASDVVRRDRIA